MHLLPEQEKVNRELEKAYKNIVAVIKKTSALPEDPELRSVIMVDHKLWDETEATIHECITPYCNLSLGVDDTGYFNIVYSIHYEAPAMIGQYTLSQLIRQINLWTMIGVTDVAIEHSVWVHSLAQDVFKLFSNLTTMEVTPYRTIVT